MKSIKQIIIYLLAYILMVINCFGQNDTINLESYYYNLVQEHGNEFSKYKGTGYNPFMRMNDFRNRRIMADGRLGSSHRFELYKEYFLQQSLLKRGTPKSNWKSQGPDLMETYSGRVISHAFDPFNPEKLWVGSASGGLWMTEDLGDSWQPMTDGIPSTGIGAIAIHPEDPDIIIIGTGEGFSSASIIIKPGIGIFKSKNGGKTWEEGLGFNLQSGVSIMDIVWHPVNHNIVWAAATNGLWKSIDGGDNWTFELGDGTNHINFIIDDIIIQKDNPDIMYIAIESVGIFKSSDAGKSFTQLTSGLPISNINIIKISQCETVPQIIYASIIRTSDFGLAGVYKTINGGENWVRLESAPNAPCSPQFTGFCQGWYNNFITVSPFDPNHVYFGGVTLWQSRNGGADWTQKDRLICPNCAEPPTCTMYADFHAFGFSPHDSLVLFSFNDGGVAKSIDGGNCFQDVNNGLQSAQFFAISSSRVDPDIIIGGLQDHGLQGIDNNENLKWFRWGWFDGSDVETHSNDKSIYYGSWYDGTYWRYVKNVNQYAIQITSGMNLNENTSTYFAPIAIDPINGQTLLGSTQQRMYKSENGGESWQAVLNAQNVSDIRFSEADSNFAYAASWTGNVWKFYRSENNGSSWIETLSSPGWRVTDIRTSPEDPLTVYATRNSINANTPHVYKSTDGGETWLPIQGDMPDIIVNALALDFYNPGVLFVATDLGVFMSENDGKYWSLFNDGMPITYVYDIEFNPTDSTLIAGTFGRGVYRTKLNNENSTNINDLSEPRIEVYPNPASTHFFVNFDYNLVDLEIRLLNSIGQHIPLDYEKWSDNQFKIDLNRDDINSGLYFVEIISRTRRFIKQIVIN